jgi:excisionase family DNA binding protein
MNITMVELMTVQEVALLLKLHPRTVMKMAASRELPAGKVGRKWRFERHLIEKWLAERLEAGSSDSSTTFVSPADALSPDQVMIFDAPTTRDEVLRRLAEIIYRPDFDMQQDELIQLIFDREEMFTTATEVGVAFPHPRHPIPSLEKPALALGVVPEGVDFGVPGGAKTYVVAMLCSQDDRYHVHSLSLLARLFRKGDLVEQLRRCGSREEIVEIFRQAEENSLVE